MSDEPAQAFVIWIDVVPPRVAAPAELRGRVEHVQTSTREPFVDRASLLAFIERMAGLGEAEQVERAQGEPAAGGEKPP